MTDGHADAPTGADVSVGDTGPEVVVAALDRADFVKYAGASGDFNPIHYNEPLATAAGYESVFAQGMFTAGVAAQAVADWFGLANVRSYGVRFQAQVWPGDTVTAVAEATDVEDDGDVVVVHADVRVTNQDGETVVTGEASAELPAGP